MMDVSTTQPTPRRRTGSAKAGALASTLFAALVAGCGSGDDLDAAPAADLPPGFVAAQQPVSGGTIGYVKGGSGPPLVLLHGWPQTWYEWHNVLPELAKRYTVIAPDLRGIGLSAPARDGFDKASMAADLHALLTALDVRDPFVVGHDIGGMTAYAFAITYPGEAKKVVIADVPLPGMPHFALIEADPRGWHFNFHQAEDGIAEVLLSGRVFEYYRWFTNHFAFDDAAVSDDDVRRFAAAYEGVDGGVSAGLGWYRAFPADKEYNASKSVQLTTPVLLMGGEYSLGPFLEVVKGDFVAKHGGPVETFVVAGSGHWLPEEQPQGFLQGLLDFLAR
jgi:pimeloyl-ACP methyl ester carboxylesterase